MDNLESQKQRIRDFFEGVALNERAVDEVLVLGPDETGVKDHIYVDLSATGYESPISLIFPVAQTPDDAQGAVIIARLLSDTFESRAGKEVSADRIYLDSIYAGTNTYHIVTAVDSGIIIDQISIHNKYQDRVFFEQEEIEPLLRWLLLWYIKATEQRQRAAAESVMTAEQALGDLDDHPF